MIRKYSIADFTLIAIRCNTPAEVQTLQDFFYFEIDDDPERYSNAEISTIFTVLDGKTSYFKQRGIC